MVSVLDKPISSESRIFDIAEKVYAGKRITREEALRLYKEPNLLEVGALGEYVRRNKAEPGRERYVYYIHNMHLNPTNYCVEPCRFCSYGKPGSKGYQWTVEETLTQARRGIELGINEIHMVGGLTPMTNLAYYQEVISAIKREFPEIHIKAMTAVEIEYLANLEGISYKETLERLVDCGLGSMPGGGAEIFDETVRSNMRVKKAPAHTWLEIHGIAHSLGLNTTATMLTGIGETIENKVDHMLLMRDQQDISKGFMCFIPLKCYYEGTDIEEEVDEPSNEDLLRDIAISRILLDNFPHIKAYWIQLGVELAQAALSFGADDLDGTILEEKITHAAGAKTPLQLAKERMEDLISSAGYVACERDTVYNIQRVVEPTKSGPSISVREDRIAQLIS